MKTVTYQEFLRFKPCWLKNEEQAAKLREIGARREEWTAMDVLNLPDEEVSAADKLWAVLRDEFIEAPVLHEFACRCAEDALKLVDNPDPRSVAAIEAKRKWLRGEITDEELKSARKAACSAACSAAWYSACSAARDAAWSAACSAACSAAWSAASDAARAAWSAARDAARAKQVEMLKGMLDYGD